MKLYQRLLLISLFISSLAACSSSQPDYSKIPEVELFSQAQEEMRTGAIKTATSLFEQMDKIYPFGPYSQQVQLDLIYSYYKSSDYPLAIASIDRFLKLNPTHPNVDWVLYLRGLCNMLMNDNPIQEWFGIDRSNRDQSYAIAAFKDFSHLVKNYPTSLYNRDAGKRLNYLKNQFAKQQYHIVNYFNKRQAYVAVINRVESMLAVFPNTLATRRSLPYMAKAYSKLGLTNEAQYVEKLIAINGK